MPSVGKELLEHVTCGTRDYPASGASKAGMKTDHSSHRLKFQGMVKVMAWWKLARFDRTSLSKVRRYLSTRFFEAKVGVYAQMSLAVFTA